jgi:prohibitin 2
MKGVKEAFEKAGGKIPNGNQIGGAAATIAKLAFAAGGLALAAYGASQSLITVQPGHIGVIYNRIGGLDETKTCREGLNFIIPWFQRAIIYNVRTRPQLVNSQSGSKDLQMVQISLRVLVRPDSQKLQHIYRRLGQDYDERVLPSIVNEITKAVIARYNASELLTKRDFVSKQIRDDLVRRAREFAIIVEDVSITHLAFSKEYTAAVEAKQVAQQDAERARYIVDKAIQEKKKIIVKAEGEARSAELIGKAIQHNPAFIQLRRIETAREVANIIAGSSNKIYLSADTLQLNQLGNSEAPNPGYAAATKPAKSMW